MEREPVRRLAAYAVDYLLIATWCGALFILFSGYGDTPPSDTIQKARGHLTGFLTLTLPVLSYFSLTEAYLGRTLGKWALGLRVQQPDGKGASLLRALARNGLKFLPWEIAHAAIWYVPGRPFLDDMPLFNLMICLAALSVALLYVGQLFVGSGRTAYDQISRTLVVRNRP